MGNENLKIGELAERAQVTKRTIDHYTNLGLLHAERSPSNYRYYDISAVSRLEFIENHKKNGMPLSEIKQLLHKKDLEEAEEIDVLELRLKIKGLQEEVSDVLAQLDKKHENNHEYVKKQVSSESMSLIQALLLLLN
ncbi:MerR family transcriptional regulator [Bacillus mesophilum]|uniref:MerR family transcriptional regulator n=1 Tax=Bacillus mesophilum TaxID=1071718 RepID=UPI003084071A